MSVRDDIMAKAFIYLDEVGIHQDSINAEAFPCDKLLDESGEWVLRVVPLHAIGKGKMLCADKFSPRADGSGSLPLPPDFIRLISFKIAGWQRPVIAPIYDYDPQYRLQFNKVLRGGVAKPVVVISKGGTLLEYFSSPMGTSAKIEDARYVGYTIVDESYPANLRDLLAWRVAEMVSSVMNDHTVQQMCAAKIKEYVELL